MGLQSHQMNYPVKKSHFSVLFQSEFSFAWGCPSSGWQLLTLLLVIQNHTGWAPHLHWNRISPSCFTTQFWPPPVLSVYPYNFLLPLSGQESRADIVRQSYKRKCMSRVYPQHIEKGLGDSCRVTQNSPASLQGSWCSQQHLWCENCDSRDSEPVTCLVPFSLKFQHDGQFCIKAGKNLQFGLLLAPE